MSEQLDLFPEAEKNYKVIHFSGGMRDTNGNEIYFVKTIRNGLTKYLAEKICSVMNKKRFSSSTEYFELTK